MLYVGKTAVLPRSIALITALKTRPGFDNAAVAIFARQAR
jgi:hypothetical protein